MCDVKKREVFSLNFEKRKCPYIKKEKPFHLTFKSEIKAKMDQVQCYTHTYTHIWTDFKTQLPYIC